MYTEPKLVAVRIDGDLLSLLDAERNRVLDETGERPSMSQTIRQILREELLRTVTPRRKKR